MRAVAPLKGLPFRALIAVATAATAAAACSALLDTSKEQCTSDSDCTSRGGRFAAAVCSGSVCVAADAATDGARSDAAGCVAPPLQTPSITLSLSLTDFLRGGPVENVLATACPNPADPACSAPESTRAPDDGGVVRLPLSTTQGPFKGYIIVVPAVDGGAVDLDAAGDVSSFYIPSRNYYGSPLPLTTDTVDTLALGTFGALAAVTSTYNLGSVDPSLGMVFVTTVNCAAQNIAGVSVSIDLTGPTTVSFYFVNGLPVTTATQTDSSGLAGFVNVPVGARVLTTKVASTGQPLGAVSLFVLPSTISNANVGPTSTP